MSEVVAALGAESPAIASEEMSQADYRTMRETGKGPVTPKPSAETVTPEKEDADSKTDPDSETGEEVQEHKKKGGFQKRIDKLTREKAELEARLAGQPAATKPPETAAEPDKQATGKPIAANFESYEAFNEALVDWKLDQKETAKTKAADDAKAKTAAKEAGEKWQERITDARAHYEDFDKVALSDAPISKAVHDAIVGSENGADLAYFLGQNPAERERINKLSPLAATLALGKILASIEASAEEDGEEDEGPEDKKPKVSAAPAPIKPVGTKAATAGKRLDDMSNDDYRKARESGKLR